MYAHPQGAKTTTGAAVYICILPNGRAEGLELPTFDTYYCGLLCKRLHGPTPLGVTIYHIAKEAGVSIATVSRVFNASPRVSDSTREQVLAVATQLGYQPHVSARNLAKRRSSVVAAVVPMLTNYFFVEILRGLQDRMAASDFDLLVFSARTLEEVDAQMRRALQRGRSAGLFMFSSPISNARALQLSASEQAIVLVDSTHESFDSVSTDNVEGGQLATQHLIDTGAMRIALISAHPDSVPARDRTTGYTEALVAAGRTVDPDLIVTEGDLESHGFNEKAGYDAMQTLLSLPEPPDAVFATSDIQAIGALQALRAAGRQVPRDVRVVGYDDILLSRHVGLSTVRQQMYNMGKSAAELLVQRMDAPGRETEHRVLSPDLVVRSTTDDAALSVEAQR